LLDLDRLKLSEFEAWANVLENVQKQRDQEAREAGRGR
jgi:hypothetical protein